MIFEWFSIKICSVGCFLYLFWSKYNRPLCVMPISTVCHNMYAIYNVLYVEHSIFPSLDFNHMFVWACIGTNWMQTLKSKYFNFHSRIESLELILLSSCYVFCGWFSCFDNRISGFSRSCCWPAFAQISAIHLLPFYLFIRKNILKSKQTPNK